MTSVQRMESRLEAWRSFRGIARASRTLAASHALHWAETLRRVSRYLSSCVELARGLDAVAVDAPRITLAIGTDLGLCGPLNARVAEAARQLPFLPGEIRIVVGDRLATELRMTEGFDRALWLPGPSSFEAIEAKATELGTLVQLEPERTHLRIVVTSGVGQDGHPLVSVWDGAPAETTGGVDVIPRRGVALTPLEGLRVEALRLLWHARVCHALTRAATSEAEARWRAMTRAHDAADRRIREKEREIRKLRQESITQEMLEVRRGRGG